MSGIMRLHLLLNKGNLTIHITGVGHPTCLWRDLNKITSMKIVDMRID